MKHSYNSTLSLLMCFVKRYVLSNLKYNDVLRGSVLHSGPQHVSLMKQVTAAWFEKTNEISCFAVKGAGIKVGTVA